MTAKSIWSQLGFFQEDHTKKQYFVRKTYVINFPNIFTSDIDS